MYEESGGFGTLLLVVGKDIGATPDREEHVLARPPSRKLLPPRGPGRT
jgi:hypothetical protein